VSIARFKPGKKKCEICGNEFDKDIRMPFKTWCSHDCATALALKRRLKQNGDHWKKVEKPKMIENLKTLSDYENDAKRSFQKWVRLRDKNLPCISCQKWANRFDGGHFYPGDPYSGMIFLEDNCHKQCSYNCNKQRHGNLLDYRIHLITKIGIERVQWLDENKDRLKNYKWSRPELIAIKQDYDLRIKILENAA
jgi:hypothetical protein